MPKFDIFCTKNNIITLCMPASLLLQPLDVGFFWGPKDGVWHLARRRIFYVDKAELLGCTYTLIRRSLAKERSKVLSGSQGFAPLIQGSFLENLLSRPPHMTTSLHYTRSPRLRRLRYGSSTSRSGLWRQASGSRPHCSYRRQIGYKKQVY